MAVSSYNTKKGTRWRFTITIRDAVTKKRKDKARGGFETKRDAVLGEAEFRKLLEMNGDNGIDSSVDDIFKFYIEQRIKEGVKEQTIEGYKMRYNSTYREMIGKKKIRKINAMLMQQVMDELTPNYTSMDNHKSLINAVFKLAKSMGIITNNPIDIVVIEKNKLKKKREDDEKFLNAEELKDFFESLNKKLAESKYLKDSKMLQEQALFTLLVLTGMRVGEALGLEWSDIDFENKKININKTQTVINGKSVISSTKTKQSDRTIPIESKYLIELLKKWKIKQKEAQIVYNCDNDILSNTVFYNISRNKRYSNMTINRKIKEVCKFNDTKLITAHAFRHTFVSLMAESETTKNKLSKYVGHVAKDKNMTDNYTHTGSEYLKEIAHRADKVISPLVK